MAENYYSYLDPPSPTAALPTRTALPPDSDEEFFADIARQALQADETPRVEQPGVASRILGGIGDVVGAQKHGVDYLAREAAGALGAEVHPDDTTGRMVRRAVGLESTPEQGIPGALAGRGIEFATDILTDPLTYETAILGKAVGAGASAGRFLTAAGPEAATYFPEAIGAATKAAETGARLAPLHTAVGAGFTGMMGLGALQEGMQAAHTIGQEGFTPRAAEEVLGTGLSGLGALAGGVHLASMRPKKPLNPAFTRGLQRLVEKGELAPEEAAEAVAREQGLTTAQPQQARPRETPQEAQDRIDQEHRAAQEPVPSRVAPEPQPTPPPSAQAAPPISALSQEAPRIPVEAPPEPVEPLNPPPRVEVAAPPPPEVPSATERLLPIEQAPPAAGPRKVVLEVNGEQKVAELSSEQAEAWDEAATRYQDRRARLQRAIAKGDTFYGKKDLKALGFEYAAEKRRISGLLTAKEQANKAAFDAKIRPGDRVVREGQEYEVLAPPAYGKVQVADVDGTVWRFHHDELEKVPARPQTEAPPPVEAPPTPNPSSTVPVAPESIEQWAQRIEPLKALGYTDKDILSFSAEGNGLAHVDDIIERGRPKGTRAPQTRFGGKTPEGPPPTPPEGLEDALRASLKPPVGPEDLQEASRQHEPIAERGGLPVWGTRTALNTGKLSPGGEALARRVGVHPEQNPSKLWPITEISDAEYAKADANPNYVPEEHVVGYIDSPYESLVQSKLIALQKAGKVARTADFAQPGFKPAINVEAEEIQESRRRPPLPPGALAGTEPLAEQIFGKGYNPPDTAKQNVREAHSQQVKTLGKTEARQWLVEEYLQELAEQNKRLPPEEREAITEKNIAAAKRTSDKSLIEEIEDKRSRRGSPLSIYSPDSPAARVLARYPHRQDFIHENGIRLLAQDTPKAREIMSLPPEERPQGIENFLMGASKKAQIDTIRKAHGAISLEEAGQLAADATENAFQNPKKQKLTGMSKEWTDLIREFKRTNDSYEKGPDGKLTEEGKRLVSSRIEDLAQSFLFGDYASKEQAIADLAEVSNIATAYASSFSGPKGTPWRAVQKVLQRKFEKLPEMGNLAADSWEQFAQKLAGRLMKEEWGEPGTKDSRSIKEWVKARFTQDPDFVKAMGEKRAAGELQGAERNDAFKAWFGDSKVVDETGQPLTVYHGSEVGPTEFDISKQGSRTDSGYLGKGFYFGGKVDANVYGAKGAVTPVYLALKNPLELSAKMGGKTETWRGRELDRELNIREALRLPKDVSAEEVTKTVKRAGYDGVIYSDPYGGKEYVAFNPEQIKSATGNRGAFDPTNPDIRFSRRGPGLAGLIGQTEATPVEGHPDLSILNHTETRTPLLDAATESFAKEAAEPLQKLYERLRSLTGAQGGTLGGFTSSTAHEGAFVGGKSYLNPSYHFSDALQTAKLYGLEGDAEAVKSIAATRAVATLEHEFLHDLGGHKTEAEFAEALKALQTASRADPEYAKLEAALRDSISDSTVQQFRESTPTFDQLVKEKYGDTDAGFGEGALQGAREGSPPPARGAEPRSSEGLSEGGEGLRAPTGRGVERDLGRTRPEPSVELAASERHAPEDDGATLRGAGAEAAHPSEEAGSNPSKARGESPEELRHIAALASGNAKEIDYSSRDLLHSRLLDVAKPIEGDTSETLRQKTILKHYIGEIPKGKFGEESFKRAMVKAGAPTEAAQKLWEAFDGTEAGGSSAAFQELFSKLMKPQGWDHWKTWLGVWKAGFLGAPSQMANAGGNTLFQGLRRGEGQMAVILDMIGSNFERENMGLKKGERSRFFGEWGAASRGRARAWQEAWPDLKEAIRQAAALKGADLSQLEKHLGSYEEAALARLKGPQDSKLYEFLMLPFKAMEAMDDYAKHNLKWEEFYQEAYREGRKGGLTGDALLKHEATIAEEMNQGLLKGEGPLFEKHVRSINRAATYRMKQDTFQADLDKKNGWISGGAAGLNKLANDLPPLELVVPFRKTAANVAIQALLRTPYGFRRVYKAWKRGDFKADPARLYDELAKPFLGTAIMGAVVTQLIGKDLITGQGPADPKQQALKRETGWQPYSFHIGGKYIPYNRIEPLASVIGMAADMSEAIHSGQKTTAQVKLKLALSSIGKNLLNKTFLAQLSEAMQAGADLIRFGPAFAKQLTASLVPNTAGVIPVGNLASALDPTFRKTSILTAPLAKIPGVSRLLPEQETALGTPRERTGGEGILGGLQRLLLPSQVTSVRSDVGARVAGELDRLDFPMQPPRDYIEVQGRRIDLSSAQKKRLQDAQYQAVNHMNRMIQDKTYQSLPDSPEDALPGQKTKEYLLRRLLERYREPIINEARMRAKAGAFRNAEAHP